MAGMYVFINRDVLKWPLHEQVILRCGEDFQERICNGKLNSRKTVEIILFANGFGKNSIEEG